MTPNPNPSPELLQTQDHSGPMASVSCGSCHEQMPFGATRWRCGCGSASVYFSAPGGFRPQSRQHFPQTLPAPGEVDEASMTLDVWLAAYKSKPDTDVATPDHDDDLLTWGHLRTISKALATVAAANDEGVAQIIFEEMAHCFDSEGRRYTWDEAVDNGFASVEWARSAAIRLLSQGGGK